MAHNGVDRSEQAEEPPFVDDRPLSGIDEIEPGVLAAIPRQYVSGLAGLREGARAVRPHDMAGDVHVTSIVVNLLSERQSAGEVSAFEDILLDRLFVV